jgi:hypothetical protein
VERLKAAVGATVYLAEIDVTEVQLGVRITGKPFVLLGVVDFPRPDPVRGLAPTPGEVLFQDRKASRTLLFGERRLSAALIAERAKALIGEVLGRPVSGTETGLEDRRQLLGQDDRDGEADPAARRNP